MGASNKAPIPFTDTLTKLLGGKSSGRQSSMAQNKDSQSGCNPVLVNMFNRDGTPCRAEHGTHAGAEGVNGSGGFGRDFVRAASSCGVVDNNVMRLCPCNSGR